MKRMLSILTVLLGILSIAFILSQIVSRTGHKLFWGDEANEILNSCSQSYSYTLNHGASAQCSPAPLYYVLQKFVVSHVPLYQGKSLLYLFRLVSIVSAGLTLVFLFAGFGKYLGFPWGLYALFLMNNERLFEWGAENRPYMLWVFVFSVTLLTVSSLIYTRSTRMSFASKIGLSVLALGLSLVAGGGMVQAIGFLVAPLFWEHSFNFRHWIKNPSFRFFAILAAASCGVGIYYSINACRHWDAMKWDLLRTGDWNLVKGVISLLWPLPAGTGLFIFLKTGDSTQVRNFLSVLWPIDVGILVTVLFNFFMLMALAMLFRQWKDRKNLPEDKQFLLSLTMVSIIQICSAVLIGILVALAHYYFIGRIFIYLSVLRAVLIICGGYFLLSWVFEKYDKTVPNFHQLSIAQIFLVVVLLLGGSASVYGSQKRLTHDLKSLQKWPILAQVSCPVTHNSLAVISQEDYSIAGRDEFKLNFIVIFGEQLKTCDLIPTDGQLSYVIPKLSPDEKTYSYKITDDLPTGASILGFLHRPLY